MEPLDPDLRMMLEVARSWGVSPSRFAGREPRRRTRYTSDVGAVSVAVEVTEPEWTDDDRALAYRLHARDLSLCPGCRHPMDETTSPAHEFAYVAQLPVRCHRCTAAGMAADRAQDLPQPGALHIPIVLKGAE